MERSARGRAIAITAICLALLAQATAQGGGELRFCLRARPKTFHPLKVDDDASAAIRYLTGGVLVRVNRQTQQIKPGLAVSWKVSKDRTEISFSLARRIHSPMARLFPPRMWLIPSSN